MGPLSGAMASSVEGRQAVEKIEQTRVLSNSHVTFIRIICKLRRFVNTPLTNIGKYGII